MAWIDKQGFQSYSGFLWYLNKQVSVTNITGKINVPGDEGILKTIMKSG
jgi:hypothetical protein